MIGTLLRIGLLLLATLPCPTRAAATPPPETNGPASPLPSTHLHHVLRLHTNLLSGSSPETDAAFTELSRLGVRTIVSVDGARPDVERARRHGLRYIHLPVGYDGIPPGRQAELARAGQPDSGPVYVHCHHGRHRGPAAAAVIAAWTASWSPDRTRALLLQAGTGSEYPGLHRSVADTRPDPAAAARVGPLPETSATSTVVDAMILIDQHLERLEAARPGGFVSVPGQPDATPAHEATLLREQLRELLRLPDTERRGAGYRRMAEDSERAAAALESTLRTAGRTAEDRIQALQSVRASCSPCHRAHRNTAAPSSP